MIKSINLGCPLRSRSQEVEACLKESLFDIAIIGGGIHGAAVARAAAVNGLKTLLFERDDYASATSSRSSKMVHGGLRYLEMLDFKQVFEGIKAREELFLTASHIVKPERFLIPVFKSPFFLGAKMRIGLTLYDLFVRDRSRSHRWIPAQELDSPNFNSSTKDLKGCFEYCDGLMDDTRLVIDNIVSARLHGAVCLNYVEVVRVEGQNPCEVLAKDVLSGNELTILCRLVINCSGPWVNSIDGIRNEGAPSVRYSQGTHLLFSVPWKDHSLFLPLRDKGRYYFVWPHPEGTLVGTTEREIKQLAADPLPFADEIAEILDRLRRDLPHSELDRSTLSYCFAGIRTLPSRPREARTSQLSRKHIWHYNNGVLSLFGGKYTTSYWTAYEGLKEAWRLLRLSGIPTPLQGLPLEATATIKDAEAFVSRVTALDLPEDVIRGTLRRLGGNVRFLAQDDSLLELFGDTVLRGEIEWAFQCEQATCVRDIMRRRMGLELRRDHGFPIINQVKAIGRNYFAQHAWDSEADEYRAYLGRLHKLMGIEQPNVTGS